MSEYIGSTAADC